MRKTKNIPLSIGLTLGLLIFSGSLFVNSLFGKPAGERPWYTFFESAGNLELSIEPLEKRVLDNGIIVYLRQNNMAPIISAKVFMEGGLFEEPEGKEGLTSLWGKSVVYSGSPDYPSQKLSAFLELRASSFGFDASLERASFSLSSMSHFFYEDLEVVYGVIQDPIFDEAEVELLRGQSIEGIKRRLERPAAMAYLGSKLAYWKGDLRSRVSTQESLESIAGGDLKGWHEKMVKAARLSILLVGDFEEEEAIERLNKTLGSLPLEEGGLSANSDILKNGPKGDYSKTVFYQEKEIPQTTILWRGVGMPHSSPDYYALKVFDFILGGDSFNSYLTGQIRTKRGWAYSVYSHYSAGAFGGDISLFVQTKNESAVDAVMEIDRILGNPREFVTQGRVDEAVTAIKNKFVFLYETPERLASLQMALMWDELPENYLDHFLENIEKVTLEDLYRVAEKYYSAEKFFIHVVGPKGVVDEIYESRRERGASELNQIVIPM